MRTRKHPRWSRLAAALATALAAAFLLVVGPPAHAQVDTGTWYSIQNKHSGMNLDVRDVSTSNGAILQQYHPNTQQNQQFRFLDSGNGYYRIQVRHSGKVLDVFDFNTASGADIVQWDDHNGANQQWRLEATGDGHHVIVNRHSGKALDNWNWSTTAGSRVSQYDVNRSAVQQWRLTPAASEGDQPYGYLFAHMEGDWNANGEQVYFALSNGNDPLHYTPLNNGEPVLTSNVGEQGVRDPFIVQHPRTGKYYLLATDLRIYPENNWDESWRHGSRSLVVWESSNLVDWSAPRLAQVSPPEAGNTWAPEAYWDPTQNRFVVYWASKLYTTPGHTEWTYNRMMYATTTDFRTFSQARVWVDEGYSTIDSTIIQHGGTYYRYTKDERENTPCALSIFAETSATLMNTNWAFQRDCIGANDMERGEGPLVFKSNTEDKWYMFIDEFGRRGYLPFETTNLASGLWTPVADYSFPAVSRHGSVTPLTRAQYDALLARFG